MKSKKLSQLINLIIPAIVFGSVSGFFTAVVVVLYKFCGQKAVELMDSGYHALTQHLYLLPVVLVVLFGVSALLAFCYKKVPNINGGGIPTAIGILRGRISFKWFRSLIGTFTASLLSFLLGIPLGTEGPSVLMGAAVGRGIMLPFKNHKAWDRYTMTGGACGGFAVATGAPVAGIMFAVEEAHQRFSPMIFMVSGVSVAVAFVTTEVLGPLLGVDPRLFPKMELYDLGIRELWIAAVVGVAFGLFAVVFLKFYRIISKLVSGKLSKVPHSVRIFLVCALTLIAGLLSLEFVSTGHHLMFEVMEGGFGILVLCSILIARSGLTVLANTNGITGGIFIPIMAIGAVFAALVAKCALWLGLGEEYYLVMIVIGIAACIGSMMKMPLTAIIFSVEALSCYGNIIHVVVAVALGYAITEIFAAKSINDIVLENRLDAMHAAAKSRVYDTFVTVRRDSFAVGKQIRDILWPANLFVLSVKYSTDSTVVVDEHGGNGLRAGDILHVRYSTYDEEETKRELTAIVGTQDYVESEDSVV
jgi:H+/Cl- antiporter ClcA